MQRRTLDHHDHMSQLYDGQCHLQQNCTDDASENITSIFAQAYYVPLTLHLFDISKVIEIENIQGRTKINQIHIRVLWT
jgi:hypothetical protein